MDPLKNVSTRVTPQSERADARQKRNAAGGYVFTIDDEARLRRFLTIGSSGGTYYVSEQKLTRENADVVINMATNDHATLRRVILDVSLRGAAPKQNPTLFALAIACSIGSDDDKRAALDMLPQIARTGTMLFTFASYVQQFRGWGRGLRKGVANWYTSADADKIAYQAVKYRQREGWTHRDLLRLSHPSTQDASLAATFDWITKSSTNEHTPRLIEGFLRANEDGANVPDLVREYGLTWEMLPDAALNQGGTWEALLDAGMPQTALMRQLPRLTRLGLLPNTGGRTNEVVGLLTDPERLRRGRLHPMNVLSAQRTYASGHSMRGSTEWTPSRRVVDALDAAFYASFDVIEPTNQRYCLGMDVSGSMGWDVNSATGLTPRDAGMAMALATMAVEPEVELLGYTRTVSPLEISPRMRLDDAIRATQNLPFGGTDCAKPIEWAMANNREFDVFVNYTDSETWAGGSHVHQALRRYRESTGIAAKMIVVGMTATEASIADPNDPLSIDIAGLDAGVPNFIASFARGL